MSRGTRRLTAAAAALALAVAACSGGDADAPEAPAPTAAPTGRPSDDPAPVESSPTPTDEPDAPEPTPTPVPPPPVPAGRAELAQRLAELLDAAVDHLDDASVAVLVTDAYGREVAAVDADAPVVPASTLKVVTAAAALLVLGPQARLTTRVDATEPIGADGTLDGDLVLVGGGDPALGTPEYGRWIYPARPRTPLESLADQLVDAGLRRVTGDVVGGAPGFAGPSEPSGWLPRYFASFDARYIAGLTVDGGLATSIRWPQLDAEREAATPDASGEGDGHGEAEVVAEPPAPVSIPLIGTREEIESRLAGLDPPLARVEVVADPRVQAARDLARLLTERGVEVDGSARATTSLRASERDLASVQSPPLEDILRFAVQRSDNHLSDQLFLAVGRAHTGAASWQRAERAVRDVLERLGVDGASARLADGSGLSRDDRVTARLLVDLDRAMWSGEHAETWASLQAVAGESGTLRQRLRGTPVAGRLLGKTGTLNDVTALSGAVVGDDGERYHLAVVGNDAEGADRWVVRALMDELALLLVGDLQGCTVTVTVAATPAPDGPDDDHPADEAADEPDAGGTVETWPLGRPPARVAC